MGTHELPDTALAEASERQSGRNPLPHAGPAPIVSGIDRRTKPTNSVPWSPSRPHGFGIRRRRKRAVRPSPAGRAVVMLDWSDQAGAAICRPAVTIEIGRA